jgi:hypothetical protein
MISLIDPIFESSGSIEKKETLLARDFRPRK